MFSDRELDRLEDIVEESDAVAAYLAGMTFEHFSNDRLTRDATERCIERVIEAVVQLGEAMMAAIAPTISVSELRGMGNRLRHEYQRIDPSIVWKTATDDLPPLRDACAGALRRSPPNA